MPNRPLLTARWRELLVLNFAVPTSAIESLAPSGTEPDLHDGQSFLSIVGFRFHDTRLFGVPFPAHTHFDEINLRFYVRRKAGGEVRRGVVFIREIVPRFALAATANWLYNENYVARKMRSTINMCGTDLNVGDTIEYAWQSKIPRFIGEAGSAPDRPRPGEGSLLRFQLRKSRWNRVAACVAAPLALPLPGSLEQFIVEHYWGYVRGRDGATREYRVTHVPCDLPATYTTPLAEYLTVPPTSALVADGSAVQVFRGQLISQADG